MRCGSCVCVCALADEAKRFPLHHHHDEYVNKIIKQALAESRLGGKKMGRIKCVNTREESVARHVQYSGAVV